MNSLREERTDPLYYRLFKSFLRGSSEGSLNAHKLKLVDSENILKITRRVVEHIAEREDSVIVGRGSQQFLKDRPDILRFFLYAPREEKIRRLLARGKSDEEAQHLVETVDRLVAQLSRFCSSKGLTIRNENGGVMAVSERVQFVRAVESRIARNSLQEAYNFFGHSQLPVRGVRSAAECPKPLQL